MTAYENQSSFYLGCWSCTDNNIKEIIIIYTSMASSEVRWFYSGTIPDKVVAWFNNIAKSPPNYEKPRDDLYLVMPDDESYGIKLRDFHKIKSELRDEIQSKEVEVKRRGIVSDFNSPSSNTEGVIED